MTVKEFDYKGIKVKYDANEMDQEVVEQFIDDVAESYPYYILKAKEIDVTPEDYFFIDGQAYQYVGGRLYDFDVKNYEDEIKREHLSNLINEFSNILEKDNCYYDMWVDDDQIVADIDGDWKHDHLYFDDKIGEFLKSKGFEYVIDQEEADDEDGEDDFYHAYHYITVEKPLKEDTVKQDGKWVNKGAEGTHGEFKTKKEADAQRKAMFANGFKEELENEEEIPTDFEGQMDFLAKDEQEAIDGYKEVIDKVEDEHIKDQLEKIETEEKAHKDYLEKVKEDPSIEYTEPLEVEETEEEVVEEGLTPEEEFYGLPFKEYQVHIKDANGNEVEKKYFFCRTNDQLNHEVKDYIDKRYDDSYTFDFTIYGVNESNTSLTEAPDKYGLPTDDELDLEKSNKISNIEKDYSEIKSNIENKRKIFQKDEEEFLNACKQFNEKNLSTLNNIYNDLKEGKLLSASCWLKNDYHNKSSIKDDVITSISYHNNKFEFDSEFDLNYYEKRTLGLSIDLSGNIVPNNDKLNYKYWTKTLNYINDNFEKFVSAIQLNDSNNRENAYSYYSKMFTDPSLLTNIKDVSNPGHWAHGCRYIVFSYNGKVYHYEDYDSGAYTDKHVHQLRVFNEIGLGKRGYDEDSPIIANIDPVQVGLVVNITGGSGRKYVEGKIDLTKLNSISESVNEDLLKPEVYGQKAWVLNQIISSLNDETAYYDTEWLYVWPDGETYEDCLVDFGDEESFKELEDTFISIYIYNSAEEEDSTPEDCEYNFHRDGLYNPTRKAVEVAHQYDKQLGLEPIQVLGVIKECVDDVRFMENVNEDEKDRKVEEDLENPLSKYNFNFDFNIDRGVEDFDTLYRDQEISYSAQLVVKLYNEDLTKTIVLPFYLNSTFTYEFTGKYIPATRLDPAEYPELDWSIDTPTIENIDIDYYIDDSGLNVVAGKEVPQEELDLLNNDEVVLEFLKENKSKLEEYILSQKDKLVSYIDDYMENDYDEIYDELAEVEDDKRYDYEED